MIGTRLYVDLRDVCSRQTADGRCKGLEQRNTGHIDVGAGKAGRVVGLGERVSGLER